MPHRHLGIVLCWAFLAVALTLRSTEAHAQELEGPRTLVVRAAAGYEELMSQLADALVVTLRAAGVDARIPERPMPPPDESEALDAATEAYENLSPQEARHQIEALLARADRSGGEGLTRDELIRALLLLASSARVLGDEAALQAALDRALVVEPALELSPMLHPPWLRELLEARRSLRANAPRATLVILGEPAGACLTIDGQPHDSRPEGVRLSPGAHLLRVTTEGYLAFGRRVDLEPGVTRISAELEPDHLEILANPGAPGEPVESLDEAARALGAPALLVEIALYESRLEAVATDMETGREASVTSSVTELPEVIAARLVEELTADSLEDPEPEPPRSRRSARIAWIVSGVTLAVVTSVVVGLLVAAPWEGEDTVEARWHR
jgi:hypothetical protein